MKAIIHNKYILLQLILLCSFIAGCKKEKSPFTGKDNFITAFSLKKSGTVFTATVTDSLISVKAPEGFSLDSAVVSFSVSENASIYPDPGTITSWNEEMLFVVTSHNSMKKTFRYTIERSSIMADGSIVLGTQADVEVFGNLGITEISGSLIIGNKAGTDSITTLAPLYKLRKIGYSLTINPTYAGKEFVGFDNLKEIGDGLIIESVNKLEKIALPELISAGRISIKTEATQSVIFPALRQVKKSMLVQTPLAGFSFPQLQTVGETLNMDGVYGKNAPLAEISFPSLKEAGNIWLGGYQKAGKIELPELTRCGDITLFFLNTVYAMITPKLQTLSGKLSIPEQTEITELVFPALRTAGTIEVLSKKVNAIELPLLNAIDNDLRLATVSVKSIKGFTALTSIKGELYLRDLPNMSALELPASLREIGILTLNNRQVNAPSEIDVRGYNIKEIRLEVSTPVKLIGDEVYNGTLTVNPSSLTTFPQLQGFVEIDSLSFGGYISNINDLQVPCIKKIKKGFQVPNNNVQAFNMPDLESVGGDFIINHFQGLTVDVLDFPKLKKVAGNFNVMVQSESTKTLRLSALQSIGGNCSIGTGFDSRCLSSILFPGLETIGGKLTIYAEYADWYPNTALTNLDGFSMLKKVNAIEVSTQSVLESFEGLKNAFPSINETGWKAFDNGYNPTYNDLAAGKWINP